MAVEEKAWEKSSPGSEGPEAGRGYMLPRISKHMYVAGGNWRQEQWVQTCSGVRLSHLVGCSKGVEARCLVEMNRWLAEVSENFQRTLAFKSYQRILVKIQKSTPVWPSRWLKVWLFQMQSGNSCFPGDRVTYPSGFFPKTSTPSLVLLHEPTTSQITSPDTVSCLKEVTGQAPRSLRSSSLKKEWTVLTLLQWTCWEQCVLSSCPSSTTVWVPLSTQR